MDAQQISRSFRRLLDGYFGLIIGVLIILSLLGGMAAFVAGTGVHGTTSLEHSATVQESNPIYDTGSELTGSTFFASIAPELQGEYEYTYQSGPLDEVIVETEITTITRTVDEETFGEEYWRVTDQLETDRTAVEVGDSAQLPFTVEVAEEMDRIEEYDTILGESPGNSEIVVVIETEIIDPDADGSVVATEREEVTIALDGVTYSLEDDEEGIGSFVQNQSVIIQQYGGIGILFVSLVSISLLLVARHRGTLALPEEQDAQHRFEYERKLFDDWISEAKVPEEQLKGTGVELTSLEELVNVAIDCHSRVLEDLGQETFYVLDGANYYVLNPRKTDRYELSSDGSDDIEMSLVDETQAIDQDGNSVDSD